MIAPAIGLLIAAGHVYAIPQDDVINNSASPPAESVGSNANAAAPDVDHYFERGPVSNSTADLSPALQRTPSANESLLWNGNPEKSFKVIGGYSERFRNMDVDEMVDDAVTNETMLREQIAQLPLDPDVIQNDLRTPTNDNQLAQLMHQIRKSLATTRSPASTGETKGLMLALTYLVMAAVIIVVIFARR